VRLLVKIIEILTKIFQSYGFNILSTSEYSKYLLASKDNVVISIGYRDPNEATSIDDLRKFLRNSKKDRSNRRIFISVVDYSEDLTRFADQKDIQLWDKDRLQQELGKAFITEMTTSETKSAGETATKSFFDIFSESKDSSASDSKPSESIYDLGFSIPTAPFGEQESARSVTTGSGYADEDEEDYRIIKPRIDKNEALKMAKKIMEGFRFDLELIPYYIYNYTCDLILGGRTPPQRNTGTIGINALTKQMEEWPPIFETVRELDDHYTRLPPRITEDEAYESAFSSIISINTKIIETKEEKDSAIIIEKKRVEPKPDAIEITKKGLVYLPAWCIEGSNGVMIIDATTSKVLKEDIFRG
jgi:hypothetical protein